MIHGGVETWWRFFNFSWICFSVLHLAPPASRLFLRGLIRFMSPTRGPAEIVARQTCSNEPGPLRQSTSQRCSSPAPFSKWSKHKRISDNISHTGKSPLSSGTRRVLEPRSSVDLPIEHYRSWLEVKGQTVSISSRIQRQMNHVCKSGL